MIRLIQTVIALLFFLPACNRQQQLKAKIFERREISENRLMIKYKYLTGTKTYTDSASVKNTVIDNDSINIIIDPGNPKRSLPDFTR